MRSQTRNTKFTKRKKPLFNLRLSNPFANLFKTRSRVSKKFKGPKAATFANRKAGAIKRRIAGPLSYAFGFVVLIGIFALVVAAGYRGIRSLRGESSPDRLSNTTEMVAGFESLPVYPNSKYAFENISDRPEVKEIISAGRSAYRMPAGETIEDVSEYYKEELKAENGWQFLLSVPLTSEEMKFGEYWFYKGYGVRIYIVEGDVWYEKLKEEDARSGLSRQVILENEREAVFATDGSTRFVPNFPWEFTVPKDYLVRYFASAIEDRKGVEISKISEKSRIYIVPVAPSNDAEIFEKAKQLIESEEYKEREIIKESLHLMTNSKNGLTYLVGATKLDEPLFEKVKAEMISKPNNYGGGALIER